MVRIKERGGEGGREEKREGGRKEGKESRWECFGVQQALTGEIDWREIKNDVSKRFRNKVRGHRQSKTKEVVSFLYCCCLSQPQSTPLKALQATSDLRKPQGWIYLVPFLPSRPPDHT